MIVEVLVVTVKEVGVLTTTTVGVAASTVTWVCVTEYPAYAVPAAPISNMKIH